MNTMHIEGISLSQFNDKTGFQLIMTVPELSILTQEQFNLCSDLILPREELCEKIIAIEYKKDFILLGMPSLSVNKPNDKRYHREKYIYSVSILVKKEDYTGLVAKQNLYKEIIRKLAYYFKFLQVLLSFNLTGTLIYNSQQSYHYIYNHPTATEYLKKLLWKIFNDINLQKRCFLNHLCSHYTFINLNYSPIRQTLQNNLHQDIKDCEVPVTNLTAEEIDNYVQSELGRKLLKYAYHGEFTIKKICDIVKEVKQVEIKHFYKKAVEKGLVFMLDMFSLSNVYILTDKIHDFLNDSEKTVILTQVKNSILLQGKNSTVEFIDENQLLFLYGEFNRLMPLSKIVAQNKSLFMLINVIKFVRLGVILGILKRVHHHVLYFQTCPMFSIEEIRKYYRRRMNIDVNNPKNAKFLQDQRRRLNDLLRGHLMNNDSMDQVCCSLEIDQQSLLQMISPQQRYIFSFPQ